MFEACLCAKIILSWSWFAIWFAFERGDYEVYSGSQLRACFDFPVDGDTLDMAVANRGSDGVCFGGVIVRTAGGDAMDCVMPIARKEMESAYLFSHFHVFVKS